VWYLAYVVLLVFPAVGALTAWVAALRSWRTARTQISSDAEVREARGKMIALAVMPATLIVFGFAASLLVLGETTPDAIAQPAALAYGVPGFLSGLGTAIIYRRGLLTAVTSKQGFGRVMPLAVMPETSAVFGMVVSNLLIGRASSFTGVTPSGTETAWLVSALAMVGGIGGPVSAWLAASAWDFTTTKTWPRALARSGRGGMFTVACFAFAMAILGEWLILAFVLVYFGVVEGVGVVLFARARHKRLQGTKPS